MQRNVGVLQETVSVSASCRRAAVLERPGKSWKIPTLAMKEVGIETGGFTRFLVARLLLMKVHK